MSDDNFISLGCEDGAIRVLSTSNQKIPYTLLKDDKSPVTCLSGTMETSGVKNSLMATHTGGTL